MFRDNKAIHKDLERCIAVNVELKLVNENNKKAIEKNVATIDKFNKFLNTFSLINQQWKKWSNDD